MSTRQICQQNEQRLCLLVSNAGTNGVWLSTQIGDLVLANPVGIWLGPLNRIKLSWIEVGEICWLSWYATCNDSPIVTWEWLSTPQSQVGVLSPTEIKDDYLKEQWRKSKTAAFVKPTIRPRPHMPVGLCGRLADLLRRAK